MSHIPKSNFSIIPVGFQVDGNRETAAVFAITEIIPEVFQEPGNPDHYNPLCPL